MVNNMLSKTLQIKVHNYLPLSNNEWYFTMPKNVDVIKSLISKASFCTLSEVLYPVSNQPACLVVLNVNV